MVDNVLSVADDLRSDLGIAALQRFWVAAAEPDKEDLLCCKGKVVLARRLEFQPGFLEAVGHFSCRVVDGL